VSDLSGLISAKLAIAEIDGETSLAHSPVIQRINARLNELIIASQSAPEAVTPGMVAAVVAARCEGCGRYPFEACNRPPDKACFREHHGGQRSPSSTGGDP
jgi:hypothetical protein